MSSELLKKITTGIIQAQERNDELQKAIELADYFASCELDQLAVFRERGGADVPTLSGIAISSLDAAQCTTDYLRTTRFIKGIHAALSELIRRFPDQRLRILYAGCGPYATLLLPVLPFFSAAQLELVLLDINTCSLESVSKLFRQLKYDHAVDFVEADATTFKGKDNFHLIVTETMFKALIREPQVAITEHLRLQLVENGIFIPEEIKLDLACTSFADEPILKSSMDPSVQTEWDLPPAPERLLLGRLFSISGDTDFETLTLGTSSHIESEYYKITKEMNNYPDVCIYTLLRIFGTIYLHPSESLITNPHCVASLANMRDYSHFKLNYNYQGVPGWTYQLKK